MMVQTSLQRINQELSHFYQKCICFDRLQFDLNTLNLQTLLLRLDWFTSHNLAFLLNLLQMYQMDSLSIMARNILLSLLYFCMDLRNTHSNFISISVKKYLYLSHLSLNFQVKALVETKRQSNKMAPMEYQDLSRTIMSKKFKSSLGTCHSNLQASTATHCWFSRMSPFR
jgi:hypothetical protein